MDNNKGQLSHSEVVGLLNHLHQENQQLKHYKLYEDNKRLQTIIADLKEENEQLRKEKIEANAFIVENGLAEEFVKWTTCIVGENDE